MRTLGLFGILTATLLNSATSSNAQTKAECEAAAWSPEVLEFHGDAAAIDKRLKTYDPAIGLDVRRVFLVIVETEAGAQVSYFEQAKDSKEKYAVTTWATDSASDFKKALATNLLARKGKGCAGVMAHDLLGKEAADKLKAGKELAGKATASGVVAHVSPPGEEEAKKYKRVTIVVLC